MLESAKPRYLSSDAIERCFGKEVKAWAVDPASLELVALNFEILANKEVYAHDRGYWLSRRFVMQVRTIDDIDYPLVHPFVFKSKAGALTQIGFSSPGPNQIGPQVSSLRIDHSEVVPGQGSVSGWDRVNLSSHYELPGNEGFLAVLAGNTTIQAAGASLDCQSGSKLAGAANDGWSSVRQWVFLDGCRSNDALATAWERNRVKAIAERSMTLENGLLQFGLFTSLVHPPQSSWQHFLRDPLSHVVLKRYIPNDPTTLEIPVSVTFNEHQTLPIEAIDFRIEPKWSSVPGQGEIGTLYPAVATIPSQTLLKGKSVLNEEFEMVLHSATQVDLKSDPQNRNRELILNGSGKLEAFAISTGLNVPICNKSNWRRKPISSDFPLASMKGIYLRSRVLDDAKPKLHCFEQGT
jgi:hypothetical protein